MADVLYLQMNIVGMAIVFILLMHQHGIANGSSRQKPFLSLNYSIFVILFLDSMMWMLNGKRFPFAKELLWAATCAYYFMGAFIAYFWFIYISKFFYQKRSRGRWHYILMYFPLLINTFLILINLKYPVYFAISESNFYARGPFFVVSFLVVLPYILVSFIQCFILYRTSENVLQRKDCGLIMKIHIPPLLGIIAQVLIYGYSFVWICEVLSLLCFFINFQNNRIFVDPLTQMNNRYQFNVCMKSIHRDMKKGGLNSILFIDIDKFKGINDRFGHVFGDRVLVAVANILSKACQGEETIVGRYGGDEFYVFCKQSAAENIILWIHEYVAEYNLVDEAGVDLSLSIGASEFLTEELMETEDILELADKAMYRNKLK